MKVKNQSLTLKLNISLLSKISEIVLNIKLKESLKFPKFKMSNKKEEIDLFIF